MLNLTASLNDSAVTDIQVGYRWLAFFTFAFVATVGVCGNLLVVVVVFRVKNMVTPTNCYLVSLAASDTLFFLSAAPVEVVRTQITDGSYPLAGYFDHRFDAIVCALMTYLSFLAINASSLSITAFTIERYIGICHPMRARYMCTVRRARIIIGCLWVFSIIYNSPWFYLAQLKPLSHSPNVACTFKIQRTSWSYKVIFTGDLTTFYVIPVVLYVLLYARIAVTLSSRPMSSVTPPPPRHLQRRPVASSASIRSSESGRATTSDAAMTSPLNRRHRWNLNRGHAPANGVGSSHQERNRDLPQSPGRHHTDGSLWPRIVLAHRAKEKSDSSSLLAERAQSQSSSDNRYGSFALRQQSSSFTCNNSAKVTKGRGQVVKMLAVVVCVFAVCWLPYRAMVMYNSFASTTWAPPWYLFFAKVMIFINCAINPILYNVMSGRFRKASATLLHNGCQRDRSTCHSEMPASVVTSTRRKKNTKNDPMTTPTSQRLMALHSVTVSINEETAVAL